MKRTIIYILFLGIFFFSCKKEVVENTCSEKIKFSASYAEPLTKSSTSFPSGRKAVIYGYILPPPMYGGGPPTPIPLEPAFPSILPAVATSDGSNLNLPSPLWAVKGDYQFFILSKNTNDASLADFAINSENTSQVLSNGIDYLYGYGVVSPPDYNCSFGLRHLCSKISVQFTAGTGVSGLSITSVKMKLPSPTGTEGTIDFESVGLKQIFPVASLSSSYTTIGSGDSVSTIVLPCRDGTIDMEITVSMTVGGKSYTNKIFKLVHDSGSIFNENIEYKLTANVSTKEITFSCISVRDWTTYSQGTITIFE